MNAARTRQVQMTTAAIVAAGGFGRRLGATTPKQFLKIGDRTLLERSVAAFVAHPLIDEVVVVLPPDTALPETLRTGPKRVVAVTGGPRRQDSVAAGFAVVAESVDFVVIHDAA